MGKSFSSIPRGNDKHAIDALTQVVETFAGYRGSGDDKAITIKELRKLGLITTQASNGKINRISVNDAIINTDNVVQTPHKPEALSATGGFTAIILKWNTPTYKGHLHTVIYRSQDDNFANAVEIGTALGDLYTDTVDMGSTYYYWIKFKNQNSELSPLNATGGTLGQTEFEPAYLLSELQGLIGESQFDATVTESIDKAKDLSNFVGSYLAEYKSGGSDMYSLVNPAIQAATALKDSQQQIDAVSQNIIDSAIQLDYYNDKINQIQQEEKEFRDAIFTIDPESGTATLEAVQSLRTDYDQQFNQVYLDMDAKDATISLNANNYTQSYVGDNVINKLNTAGIDISGETATINIGASSVEFEQGVTAADKFNELNDTKVALSNAGINIDGQNATIVLQTSQIQHDGNSLNTEFTSYKSKTLTLEQDVIGLKNTNANFALIAPSYDETQTYDVGDVVINDAEFKLYECKTAITTPEPFNVAKWELQGNVTGQLSTLSLDLDSLTNTVSLKANDAEFQTEKSKIANAQQDIQAVNSELDSQASINTSIFSSNDIDTQTLIDMALLEDLTLDEAAEITNRFAGYDESLNTLSNDLQSEVELREEALAKFDESVSYLRNYTVLTATKTDARLKAVETKQVEFGQNYASRTEVTDLVTNADYSQATWFQQSTAGFLDEDGLGSSATISEMQQATANVDGKFETQWGVQSNINGLKNGIGFIDDGNGNARFNLTADKLVFATNILYTNIPSHSSTTSYFAGDLIRTGTAEYTNVFIVIDDDAGKGRKFTTGEMSLYCDSLVVGQNRNDEPYFAFSPFGISNGKVIMTGLHAIKAVFDNVRVKNAIISEGDIYGANFHASNGTDSTTISGSGEIRMDKGSYTLLENVGNFLLWYGLTTESSAPTTTNSVWFLDKNGNYKRDVGGVVGQQSFASITPNTFATANTLSHFALGSNNLDFTATLSLDLNTGVDFLTTSKYYTGTLTVTVEFYYLGGSTPKTVKTLTIPYQGSKIFDKDLDERSSSTAVTQTVELSTVESTVTKKFEAIAPYVKFKIADSGSFLANCSTKKVDLKMKIFEVTN